jgi:hypothetical protein
MKKILSLVAFILVQQSCNQDDSEFNSHGRYSDYNSFKGRIAEVDNSTILEKDNNLIICGQVDESISVFKTSQKGMVIWKNIFSVGSSTSPSIVQTSSHELFICGGTIRHYSDSRQDVLLIKANSKGDTIWTKTYGGEDFDYGANIINTSDGNLLIAGKTQSFGAGSYGDIYLIKVNYNGDTLWTKSYPDPGQQFPSHLTETSNGEYLITGNNQDPEIDSRNEIYFLKVDATGKKLWDKKIGSADWKWGFSTVELSNGDLLTCGANTADGYNQVLIVKTDDSGNLLWEKKYGEPKLSEVGYSIKKNQDETYTITGSSYNVKTTMYEIILFKINSSDIPIWFKRFGNSETAQGINLIKDSKNNNIITGNYNGSIFMSIVKDNGVFK